MCHLWPHTNTILIPQPKTSHSDWEPIFISCDRLLPSLIEIIGMMYESTIALDRYYREMTGAPTLAILTRARNSVQHPLLSLHPIRQPTSDYEIVGEICHIARLIYSDMVLFPTPSHTGVGLRYASTMTYLLTLANPHLWIERQMFLIWAATLGGNAASGTRLRQFYVGLLRIHTKEPNGIDLVTKTFGFIW